MIYKASYLIVVMIAFTTGSMAQVTFRITELPEDTPDAAELYISGDFEGWSGGQEAYRLEEDDAGYHKITLPERSGTIEYKFTRGSWSTVEKDPEGNDIANRSFRFKDSAEVVDVVIAGWGQASGAVSLASTAGPGVGILDDAFPMPQLGRNRRIWIYLPPDYANSQDEYPVLYMHDGQNLFDDSTAYAGEWGVDETLDSLHQSEGLSLIVVGIENGRGDRIGEYSPWVNEKWGGGRGEDYIAFLVETLKPSVDSQYRTLEGPANTGLMGSSLGGLISHYGGIAEPGVFGRMGIFSPAFALFDSCYAYTAESAAPEGQKYYFLAGGMESEEVDVPTATSRMMEVMQGASFTKSQMHNVVDPDGLHNEAFWRREFGKAVLWLFLE